MSKDKTLKTISYQFTPEQYSTISRLAQQENRSMRRMLFHAVEFYIYTNKITLKEDASKLPLADSVPQ